MGDAQRYSFDILPLHPRPQKGEAFISYLARLAECNGITSLTNFAHVAFPEKVYIPKYILTNYPRSSYRTLSFVTGLPEEAILATTFFYLLKRFGCATHPKPMKRFLGASIASSLRYCPLCLDGQLVSFYALVWQFVSIEGCEKHACYLLDKCGHCGVAISPFIYPLRSMSCPKCSGDLRTCHTFPVQQEKLQIIRKRTFDLDFLLSKVLEQEHVSSIIVIGQQLAQKRQSTQIPLSKWARDIGLDENIILAIETGNIKMQGATFDSYVLYTEALGITLRDLWNVKLSDWLKEEDVIKRIENAIRHVKNLGEPLYRKKIKEMIDLPPQYLNEYPQAKALLRSIKRVFDRKKGSGVRREKILLERVELVIKELEAMGSLVTQECIIQMVGLSQQWLYLHPQVKTRLQQFPFRQPSSSNSHIKGRKTNRIKHVDEEHLVMQVEHAIKQLSFLGRPLTQRAVCSVVGCSLSKLRSFPRVKEIFALVKVRHKQNMIRLRRQQEDMRLVLVKQAVEELDLHNEPVILQHISEITGLSLDWLKRTKSVKEFLIKYNEENKEQQQKVKQREQDLVQLVVDTIHQLAAGGRIVTREGISQTIGLSVIHLERYKRVKKLLDSYSGEWRERKQRVQHDEQLLIARIQKAMKRIRARDKFVSLNAIRQMVHLPIGHLHEYPRVKALLQELQIHENSYQEWRLLQLEDNLVRHVEEAIAVLKSQNEAVSWLRVSLIIGSPVECLKKYSRVKRLLEQAQEEQKEQGKENKGNEDSLQESILMRDIEQAIVLLESRGEPITPRAIGNIIYLPFCHLDEYPLVKAQLHQIAEQSNGGQSGQRLFTEGELIQRVQIAIESLKADGKKVTPRRISRYIQVPLPQLGLFPEVNKILRLIDEGGARRKNTMI